MLPFPAYTGQTSIKFTRERKQREYASGEISSNHANISRLPPNPKDVLMLFPLKVAGRRTLKSINVSSGHIYS